MVLKLTAQVGRPTIWFILVTFVKIESTFRNVLFFFIKLFLGENSNIGKLFTNAMESLDEEEKEYYFSNSDSA